MVEVLLVSKPIVPPWHDSSKNLVRDLATHMQRHRPVVLSQPGAALDLPRARIEAIYPKRASGFAPGLADNARVLWRLLAGSQVPLWHFFFAPNPKTSTIGALAARARRVRTLQTVCSAPRADVDPQRVLFADRVIVLSRHTERRLLDAGISTERLRLIHPCIGPLAFRTDDARMAARTRFSLPQSAPVVVYAGDLEFGCGADLALLAHHDLPKTLGAHLVMACRAKTARAKEREKEVRTLAAELGVASTVHWLGETPFIHDLLSLADLVTMPTDTLYAKMDMPLVLVEAMALGRSVLVGSGTPAEELAQDDAALKVAPQRDAVSAATRELLEDSARRERLGTQARTVALRDYGGARMAQAYEAVYDELCA